MFSEVLIGVLSLLVGGLIGHRLAIRRDSRREFNEVVAPIVQNLLEIEEQVRAGHLWKRMDMELMARVMPYLTDRKRVKLRRLIEDYERSLKLLYSGIPEDPEEPWMGTEEDATAYPSVLHAVVKLRRFLRVR